MTTPNQQNEPAPKGSITGYGSWPTVKSKTQADWEASRNAEWGGKFGAVKDFGGDTRYGINQSIAVATAANENAGSAVDLAEEAANAAAAAEEKADIAYGLSSYWESECVVSSAEVVLGVNELLIGLCQNVPTDRIRKITDLHIALQSQPGGMVLETKKWNAAGTSNSVVHTATLGPNVTRISYNNLDISVLDKERVFWNVSSITGTVAPNVLQCLVFGVIL
ncbi:minor tail protein [Gordonia phage Mayweather]|uniref:Uncharacterized protein n=1 Tax=Gordonia phage Mayweather TaxID=2590931 RepID=A0A516KU27_9CAUD|nr:minor tail protein [Gordonia phage Mayweather]QDP45188.1 hypothetical protein SEA_MAYWEATHER_26 [Gordonia phage Mayweather]